MKVRDLYKESIIYEEISMAHYIYYLLKEKLIQLDDDVSVIQSIDIDYAKVMELIDRNVLGITPIRIFSLKMYKKRFVFIFAKNREEAIRYYWRKFNAEPLNCYEYHLDLELVWGNMTLSFREMRKDFNEFPAVAFFYNKELVND